MNRPLPESPIDLRALVLYDNYQWKAAGTSYESYEKLCNRIGEKAISYDDYEYWFNQYHKEEYLARRENDASMSLRNVSRRLRAIVDSSKPAFTSISVEVADDSIQFMLNDKESLGYVEEEEFETEDTIMILNYLKLILNNSKLQLDILYIVHWEEVKKKMYKILLNLLNSLNLQLHVKHFSFRTPYATCVPDVVKHLKPGVLEKLTLARQLGHMNIDQLYGMEQWKQAKHLVIDNLFIPIEHLSHFTSFDVSIELFSDEEVVELIDAVSTFINFKSCRLEILNAETVKDVLNLQQTESPEVFSIPNSNLLVEFLPLITIQITKI
ncbi:hypothetical protein GCK72_021180 [Caenorhabditis remanei]|uniref:DUF38 domain-containing protein n=1 Tax=Caenorhabditis remanei TaxID=31234 RepID=A0A6A5GHB1_CAERE|nr:hypothetical protein GCK72_021180 [Caenorhabditis remanei]KAF1754617.1 hypothetical protein GCK72_021180 [Caenorhabditis remanei]